MVRKLRGNAGRCRAYCTNFYTCRVQFKNTLRVLIGLPPRYCSASGMFVEAKVDCFYATMRKRCAALVRRVRGSPNSILAMIASRLDCRYVNFFSTISAGVVQSK